MTRRQLTDPFGSDDEEENLQVVEDKVSQSFSISKAQTPVRDVSMHVPSANLHVMCSFV